MSAVPTPLPPPEPTDEFLARRMLGNDVSAFEQLMRRYNRRLFRTARAILQDDAEAEDALQDAYLLAYRSLPAFRGESRLSTWLVRIVANEALGRLRKQTRRTTILPMRSNDGIAPDPAADVEAPAMDRPENVALRRELRRLIEARIDELPDAYRTVFVLRALEELSVEETAASLGIPESTVRTRFFRARGLLRETLSLEIDHAYDGAFAFAGDRCDRIVANVLARLARPAADSR